MKNVKTVTTSLALALTVIDRIAAANGTSVRTVTIDPRKSDLANGKVVGLVTVANRSRKPFTVNAGRKVSLEFMGTKLAA